MVDEHLRNSMSRARDANTERVRPQYEQLDELAQGADADTLRESMKQLLAEIRVLSHSSIGVDTFREKDILDRTLSVLRGGPTDPATGTK